MLLWKQTNKSFYYHRTRVFILCHYDEFIPFTLRGRNICNIRPCGRWRPLFLHTQCHGCWCPWWRHQMETFSELLAICAGNSPVPGEFPHKGQWRGADVFFELPPNKRLSEQSRGWWFEMHSRPLRRHCNASWQMESGFQQPCRWPRSPGISGIHNKKDRTVFPKSNTEQEAGGERMSLSSSKSTNYMQWNFIQNRPYCYIKLYVDHFILIFHICKSLT